MKPTFAAAVMLAIAGAMPASAAPVRPAQTVAADVTPFEAPAIVRAQVQYDGPRPYRRYDSGPPPSDPRYAPPSPDYGTPQGAPAPYGEPDDDEDESEVLPDEGPEEFAPDGEDEDESGALPPRPDVRTHAAKPAVR